MDCLIVECGKELRHKETNKGARAEIIGRLKHHKLQYTISSATGDNLVGWAESSRPTSEGVVGLEDSAHPTQGSGIFLKANLIGVSMRLAGVR